MSRDPTSNRLYCSKALVAGVDAPSDAEDADVVVVVGDVEVGSDADVGK